MLDHLDDVIRVVRVGPSVVVSFGPRHDDRMLITRDQARVLAGDLLEALWRPRDAPSYSEALDG